MIVSLRQFVFPGRWSTPSTRKLSVSRIVRTGAAFVGVVACGWTGAASITRGAIIPNAIMIAVNRPNKARCLMLRTPDGSKDTGFLVNQAAILPLFKKNYEQDGY
jgi:hypothetical protein